MVTVEEAGRLRKADLLEHYGKALGEIATLRQRIDSLTQAKPAARVATVSSAPVLGPAFSDIECEKHGKGKANKHGQCFHCNCEARGKKPAN